MIDIGFFIGKVAENPGLAGRILEVLSAMRGQPASLAHITGLACHAAHESGSVPQMLDRLSETGVVVKLAHGWSIVVGHSDIERLSYTIEGAVAAKICHRDRDTVQLVITFPEESSFLENLRSMSPYYASVPHTTETFINLAAQANQRLVVMSPFLDDTGAEVVSQMFASTAPEVRNTLIVRKAQMSVRQAMMAHLYKHATVLDYMVTKPNGSYETFHSKAILVDSNRAYIGSANMLNSSLSVSLEMGVLINGNSALMLARFIDSIILHLTEA